MANLEKLSSSDLHKIILGATNELIERDARQGLRVLAKVKTANQLRYETIQQAKEFVKKWSSNKTPLEMREMSHGKWSGGLYLQSFKPYGIAKTHDLEFIVNVEKRTVVALIHYYGSRGRQGIRAKGIAKCLPDEVFNSWIGKAIALARALQIAVAQEFLDIVQPDEIVVGMSLSLVDQAGWTYIREIAKINENRVEYTSRSWDNRRVLDYATTVIIDDTNAEYLLE